MRRHKGHLAVAAVLRPGSGPNRSAFIPTRDTVPSGRQRRLSGPWKMAGWHIVILNKSDHTKCSEGSADTLALRKGEPAARRGGKATGLPETAGLPNGGRSCAAEGAGGDVFHNAGKFRVLLLQNGNLCMRPRKRQPRRETGTQSQRTSGVRWPGYRKERIL